MAEIAAFRGIRYNPSVVGDMDKVVSPPYDIISPEDRVVYHELHPSNFVRLILGEEFESDTETDNRFTRAKSYLEEWLEKGVLVPDDAPAIYVYAQHFKRGGLPRTVRGFTCAVKVHDYDEKVILPHELTLAKPRIGLMGLLNQTNANLDSIYGLYADPRGELEKVMDRIMSVPAAIDVTDREGVRHFLWVVSDQAEIDLVASFLRDKQIAIADGHHRYEASLYHRDEVRAQGGVTEGAHSAEYTLMTIINLHQKDMHILPTHRVLNNLSEEALGALDGGLPEHFDVIDSTSATLVHDSAQAGGIGMYRKGDAKVLVPREGFCELIGGCEASKRLELNILHKLILEKILGIDHEMLRNQTHVLYTRDPRKAMELVDSGQRQIAFLLNHIDVKSVMDIANAGEKMPQKATYFHPKLLSGLVLRKLDQD